MADELTRAVESTNKITSALGSVGDDAFGQMLVRGILRRRLGIDIPTPEEAANRQLLARIQQERQLQQLSRLQVDNFFADVLADPNVARHPQVVAAGIKVDEDLINRPDEFVRLAEMMGRDINKGTMHRAGFTLRTPEQIARSSAEQAVKDTGRAVTGIKQTDEFLQLIAETRAGNTGLGQALESAVERREDVTGEDFSPGLGTDIDEPEGGRQFHAFVKDDFFRIAEESGLTPDRALPLLIEQFGGEIREQLEELPRTQDGQFLLDEGTFDVDRMAAFYMTAALLHAGRRAGVDQAQVFAQVGLPAPDTESFFRAAGQAAQDLGITVDSPEAGRQFLGLMGLQ